MSTSIPTARVAEKHKGSNGEISQNINILTTELNVLDDKVTILVGRLISVLRRDKKRLEESNEVQYGPTAFTELGEIIAQQVQNARIIRSKIDDILANLEV